jgi:hypothetical protein
MAGDTSAYEHITFDGDVQLAAATAAPVRFTADLPHKTIDV